ncbi:MAG TPA: hypothetical protein VF141_20530, partial [Chryseolinea sp.]
LETNAFTAEEIQNTSAGLNGEKHGESHLPNLDSASQALRTLSAGLIGRSLPSYTLLDLHFASFASQEHYQVR